MRRFALAFAVAAVATVAACVSTVSPQAYRTCNTAGCGDPVHFVVVNDTANASAE